MRFNVPKLGYQFKKGNDNSNQKRLSFNHDGKPIERVLSATINTSTWKMINKMCSSLYSTFYLFHYLRRTATSRIRMQNAESFFPTILCFFVLESYKTQLRKHNRLKRRINYFVTLKYSARQHNSGYI